MQIKNSYNSDKKKTKKATFYPGQTLMPYLITINFISLEKSKMQKKKKKMQTL